MSPLEQFTIKPLISFSLLGTDVSFTNSSLLMLLAVVVAFSFFYFALRHAAFIPNRLQSVAEIIYSFVLQILQDNAGQEGKKYFPLIFSIFTFILLANCLGMIPFSFTTTSHIIVTFALAVFIFLAINIIAFAKHGLHFFQFFLPAGLPIIIAPFMIVIELFTYLSRPISLSIRLAANMIAGHVLLKVIAGFVCILGVIGVVPIPLMVVLTGFEILVAILQAYIFTVLTCVYLNDALNMH